MNSTNRRSVLLAGLGVAGAGAITACSSGSSATPALINPSRSAVAAAEKKRKGTGRTQKVTLTAAPAMLDLGGGVMAKSWAFSGEARARRSGCLSATPWPPNSPISCRTRPPRPSTGMASPCATTWTACPR